MSNNGKQVAAGITQAGVSLGAIGCLLIVFGFGLMVGLLCLGGLLAG